MLDPAIREQVNYSKSGAPEKPGQDHDNPTSTAALSTSDGDRSRPTSQGFKASRLRQSKSSNLLNRISFARPKGIKNLAVQDLEKRRRAEKADAKARKDAEAREGKIRRDEQVKERQERRKASKERAKQNKEDKAEKQAQEKRVKDYYGIRGYDPDAGMLRSDQEMVAGRQAADEKTQTPQDTQRPPDASPRTGQTWGVEFGKPKHHDGKGHFSGHHDNCGEHYGRTADVSCCGVRGEV